MFSKSIRHHKILTAVSAVVLTLLIVLVGLIIFSEPIIKSLTEYELVLSTGVQSAGLVLHFKPH